MDGDGITDSADPICWGGEEPPGPCLDGETVDCLDSCPLTGNGEQEDLDGDGIGDACDCDVDGDGIVDSTDPGCWDGEEPPAPCLDGETENCLDTCPVTGNAEQGDLDGDGIGDACDCDVDGDGIVDSTDPGCWDGEEPPAPCLNGETENCLDSCPLTGNAEQGDLDGDGIGDACDCDKDGDDIVDSTDPGCWDGEEPPAPCQNGAWEGCLDNCPATANPYQEDLNADGVGDACACDVDGDGVVDSLDPVCWDGEEAPEYCTGGNAVDCVDNCPAVSNDDQSDFDGDGTGDACDCDADGDTVVDSTDPACWDGLEAPAPCWGESEGDCLDNCLFDPNTDQADFEGDGIGDSCDCDRDNDGLGDNPSALCWDGKPAPDVCEDGETQDCFDNCEFWANEGQLDLDGDGEGDACDCDADGDGIQDSVEPSCWGGNPAPEFCVNGNTVDCLDNCPTTANAEQVDLDGDGSGDTCDCDRDGDGVTDSTNAACWENGNVPAVCTNGQTSGCLDSCPNTPNEDQADLDEDGEGDSCDCDRDGDSVIDSTEESCWGDEGVGPQCTNGQTEGCLDLCPDKANPEQTDTDGDGEGDACDDDIDNDGILNGDDNCMTVPNTDQEDLDGDGMGDACPEEDFELTGGACATGNGSSSIPWFLLLVLGALLLYRRSRVLLGAGVVLLVVTGLPLPDAHAVDAMDSHSFKVSPFRQDWLAVGTGIMREEGRWNVGLFLDFQDSPVKIRRVSDDSSVRGVIDNQLTAQLLGSYAFADWFDLGIVLPVILYRDGEGYAPDGLDGVAGIGDLRLMPRFLLYRSEEGLFTTTLTPELTAPTGDLVDPFMGAEGFTLTPWLEMGLHGKRFGTALNLGYRVREDVKVGSVDLEDELLIRAGFRAGLVEDELNFLAEWTTATIAGAPFDAMDTTQMETQVGLQWLPHPWVDVYLAGGPGLTRAYGTPVYRVLSGVRFEMQELPPVDTDGDGYYDPDDACPLDPEDFDQFEDAEGCPDPDNDQDGVCDPWVREKGLLDKYNCVSSDECPNVPEDKDGFEDLDGCPDADNDQDGVCDPWVTESGKAEEYAATCTGVDKCPDVAEDKDGFEDTDGCPDADNDGDKICDPWVTEKGLLATYADQCKLADKCPNEPETYNSFMDEDGCPDELKIVLRGVQFVYNKAKILDESLPILDEVVDILTKHPHVEKIRIDGHTDSRGSAGYNRKLSDKRAKAVRDYLASKGIDEKRMTSKGFGEDKLLVKPEKTDEDFQTNRRVEFVILKMSEPKIHHDDAK